jgi:MFS family permease
VPRLALALRPTAGELLWIVDAYVLTFAGLLLVGGTLGDRFGRKPALLLGLLVFGAGSGLAAWAGSPMQLILGRAIMGVSGALIMPATLSTVTNIFAGGERTRAIAIWSAVPVLGLVAGPVVSGLLLEHFWWGSVLLINLPLIPLIYLGTVFYVPDTRNEAAPRVDAVGAGLSFAALTLLLYAFIEVPARGWADGRVLAVGTASLLVFLAFFLWERRTPQPLLDLALFGDPRFSAASGSLALVFFAVAGMMFGLSQYLQFVLGFTPLQAGVRLLPLAITSTLGSLVSARLVQPVGRRSTVAAGLAAAARDTFPVAAEVARALPGDAGSALMAAAGAAFADAMSSALLVGAAIAIMGALLAIIFIPGKRAQVLAERRDSQRPPSDMQRKEAYAGRTTA